MKNTESVKWSELRRAHGLTLQQVSEKTGYGVATINGLEKRGDGSVRLKTALAELYGINLDYVMNAEKYAQPNREYAADMAAAVTPEDRLRAQQSLRTKIAQQAEAVELRESLLEARMKIEKLKQLLKQALAEL